MWANFISIFGYFLIVWVVETCHMLWLGFPRSGKKLCAHVDILSGLDNPPPSHGWKHSAWLPCTLRFLSSFSEWGPGAAFASLLRTKWFMFISMRFSAFRNLENYWAAQEWARRAKRTKCSFCKRQLSLVNVIKFQTDGQTQNKSKQKTNHDHSGLCPICYILN